MRRFGGLRPISIVLCGLLAGGLFLAAFLDSGKKEPVGWVSANGAAAAALQKLEEGKGSGGSFAENERNAGGSKQAAGNVEASASPAQSQDASDETADPNAADTAKAADTANGSAAANAAGASDASEAKEQDGMLDINRASAEELDGLKGIGPAKAQAIVDDRAANGPFKSPEDLLRVKGIGEKLLAGIKDGIVARP